jgi:hypothetical protein
MDSTEINCIISAIEGNLKLQVILIIFRRIGYFADKLGDMSVSSSTLLSFLTSLDEVTVF